MHSMVHSNHPMPFWSEYHSSSVSAEAGYGCRHNQRSSFYRNDFSPMKFIPPDTQATRRQYS